MLKRYWFLRWVRPLLLLAILGSSGCGIRAYTPTVTATSELKAPTPDGQAAEPAADLIPAVPVRVKFEPFPLDPDLGVTAFLQDYQGFLWFGTDNGLYRYDGYTLKPFRPDPQTWDGPGKLPVLVLFEDHARRLWFATENGLVQFNRSAESWAWYPQRQEDENSLSSGRITALVEDNLGNLWVAADGSGLNRLEPDRGRIVRYRHRSSSPNSLSSDAITALAAGQDGALWIGTQHGGLDRLDPASEQFTHYDSTRARPGHAAGRAIQAIVVDPANDVWLGVQGGVLGFDPEYESFTFFAHSPAALDRDYVSSMVLDAAGNFWIGTYGDGLYRFNPTTREWAHYQNDPNDAYSLGQDEITGLMLDRTGILWIRTLTGQVNRFNPRSGFRVYLNTRGNPNSLSHDTVTAILVDEQSNWWIGTGQGGLNRFDPRSGLWTRYRHDPNQPEGLSDDMVTALAADPYGQIWVGTASGGLNAFDPLTGEWSVYPTSPARIGNLSNGYIHTLLASSNGMIWVGADDGLLNQLDPASKRFRTYPPPDQSASLNEPGLLARALTAIAEDAGGRLWIGTTGGRLYRFDPGSESWMRFLVASNQDQTQLLRPVTALLASRDGRIWAGTTGDGIYRFDPSDQTFTRFSEQEGLPDNDVYAILEDGQGALWISTAQGLSRFDPELNTFMNFDVSDGLPGDIFTEGAAYRSPSGELFFGSVSGLLSFYPEQVRANPYVPPVVITDFQLFYEPVEPGASSPWRRTVNGEEIHLSYTQNIFSFEYAALDYSNPAENQYEYRLEGFDEDWVEAGDRRQASYTNLSPGEYVFRVRATNDSGIWNEAGTSIRVVILPPFWLTGWFRILAAGLLAAAVAGGVGLRLHAVNNQKRQLQRQVEARTQELNLALKELEASREAAERAAVLEERQRLARELHDSVTQLLYGQVLSADICHKLLKKGDLAPLEENLIRLRETAGQSLKEMRLLLYELRPSSFEEEGLVHALELRLDAVERRSRIESYLEVKGEVDLPDPVAWDLYRIAIEALNNSLKHAAATRVVVRLRRTNGSAELEVQDNGQGFDVETSEKGGFGISSMRQRAKHIGGQLMIDSKPGEGTSVRVQVKLDHNGT